MKIKVDTKDLKELQGYLKRMTEEQIKEVKAEVYASGLEVQMTARSNLKDMGVWDTGHLADTIIVESCDGGMAAEIGPTAPYGPYVEAGTRPHFPPPDALESWARRHGFDSAWPICKAIAKRGLRAWPYLFPAFETVHRAFVERLRAIFERER